MNTRAAGHRPASGVLQLAATLAILLAVVLAPLEAFAASITPVPGPPPRAAALAALPAMPARAEPAARTTPALASLTARAAFVVDLSNQAELLSYNADEPLAPASTTKIVTALTVLRLVDLSDAVEIQADDLVDVTVYSNMALAAGDRLTVEDLLAGLLISSAGDAALALARHAGARAGCERAGPRECFIEEMNRTALDLRMTRSRFLNPDGRDQEGHVSTARELAIAAAALYQSPALERIVARPSAVVAIGGPNPRQVTVLNTNELLAFPTVHGVKTGTTPGAGQCLVAAVWRRGARLITVVMGSDDRYRDTQALLDVIDAQYEWVRLGRGGDLPALQRSLDDLGLTLLNARTVLLTADQATRLRFLLTIEAPVASDARWQRRGNVVFLVGAEPILRLPVFDD